MLGGLLHIKQSDKASLTDFTDDEALMSRSQLGDDFGEDQMQRLLVGLRDRGQYGGIR